MGADGRRWAQNGWLLVCAFCVHPRLLRSVLDPSCDQLRAANREVASTAFGETLTAGASGVQGDQSDRREAPRPPSKEILASSTNQRVLRRVDVRPSREPIKNSWRPSCPFEK